MSVSDARARLESTRNLYLERMVKEPDERERATLLQLVRATEAGLLALPDEESGGKYGRFKQGRQAIVHYLQEKNSAAYKEEIVQALIEGGMRRHPTTRKNATVQEIEAHTRTIIKKSLEFHLQNPRGIKAQILRQPAGKGTPIGLWNWPESRFE